VIHLIEVDVHPSDNRQQRKSGNSITSPTHERGHHVQP
jgi:hypothetical protein